MTPAPHSAPALPSAAAHQHWARHLMGAAGPAPTGVPALSTAEAARVQRHRDQLIAALQAQDRRALLCAKQAVLDAAFRSNPPLCADSPGHQSDGNSAAPQGSPALRRALRDLAWRMAGLLLPRSARHGARGLKI